MAPGDRHGAGLEAAAKKANVAYRTLKKWLQLPEFQKAYRTARRRVVEYAIGRLQQATGKAIDTLKRNLTCGHAGSEIRAALGILEHSVKAVELTDLVERVEEIERLLKECQEYDKSKSDSQTPGTGPNRKAETPPHNAA
jgi:hypothetical protein